MFLAIIWVSLFPNVKRKYSFINTVTPDEKSPLFKQSLENATKKYEKKNGMYLISIIVERKLCVH